MQAHLKRLYDWAGSMVHAPYATALLGCMFYLEAILFFPVEPILILYCMERPKRAFFYATVATCAAVLGGITSYCIGYMLWESAGSMIIHNNYVNYFISPQTFHAAFNQFKTHQGWALLAIGFTPIPFKITTLCAGFCKLSLLPLIASACIVRGVRFYGCALFMTLWGTQIKEYIDRYGTLLVLLLVLGVACIIWLLRYV